MSFVDNVKEDRKLQIMIGWSVFFLLAFPSYFAYAASSTDTVDSVGGPPGDYMIEGEFSYTEIGSGSAEVTQDNPASVFANSDAADVSDANIVGARVTLTHTDDETRNGFGCTLPGGGSTQDDQVTGVIMRDQYNASTSSTDSTITFNVYWIDESAVGSTQSNITKSEATALVNGGNIGYGQYDLDISVAVNTGQSANGNCAYTDDGETVEWTIELITLDYEIDEA